MKNLYNKHMKKLVEIISKQKEDMEALKNQRRGKFKI
jgi:hypothetical protein